MSRVITYLSKLIGIHSLAALMQLELFGYRCIFLLFGLNHLFNFTQDPIRIFNGVL